MGFLESVPKHSADQMVADFFTYTRGADEEYDRWANITGDEGWAWKNVAPFYLKVRVLAPSRSRSKLMCDDRVRNWSHRNKVASPAISTLGFTATAQWKLVFPTSRQSWTSGCGTQR